MTDVDMLIFGESNRLPSEMRDEVTAGNIGACPGIDRMSAAFVPCESGMQVEQVRRYANRGGDTCECGA